MSSVISIKEKANNSYDKDVVFFDVDDHSSEHHNKGSQITRYLRETIEKLEHAVGLDCERSTEDLGGRVSDLNLRCYGYTRNGLDLRYQIERLAVNLLGKLDATDYKTFCLSPISWTLLSPHDGGDGRIPCSW